MKEAKQTCRHWLAVSIILLAGLVVMASPSCAADLSATQADEIANVERILRHVQNSIWQQLDSQEVNALALQLYKVETAGHDEQAARLKRRLDKLEKELLTKKIGLQPQQQQYLSANAPPEDAELVRLVQKKKMLLDELARLGSETQSSAPVAAAAIASPTSTGTGSISGTVIAVTG